MSEAKTCVENFRGGKKGWGKVKNAFAKRQG